MKHHFFKLMGLMGIVALLIAFSAQAQAQSKTKESAKNGKVASSKRELSAGDKEELKAAQEVLKVMKTYHKGLFTRLFNNGTKAELMSLPDLGEKTADRIIAARPHESSAHVVLVKGIGVETYKKWVNARK